MMNLGLMDPAFLGGLGGLSLYDPDAAAYIAAVEAADGQALETGVRDAINAFVLGCKADGIWNAIKASCILAGARTLAGALVPLVGTAPTNFNFVAGDYNRKTGLMGNGSTKYLNSNRNTNADPQNSYSTTVFASTAASPTTSIQVYIGGSGGSGGTTMATASSLLNGRNRTSTFSSASLPSSTIGFIGHSRSSNVNYTFRGNSSSTTVSDSSQTPADSATHVFAESASSNFRTNARLAFYSIGESLDLALLDARVTALVNALAVAIP
jgi:cysteine synthase